MQLSLAYLDASAIEEVPVALWCEVFDALGWPASLDARRDSFGHADIADAIRRDDLSDSLLSALEALHTLGTEAGREAIMTVMRERRVRPESLPADASERELALRLYLGQRDNASLADVFARAQIQAQENGQHRRYNEFLGKESRVVPNLKSKRDALRAAILRHCQDADLGDHVQVDILEDDDVYVVSVLRTDRLKKPLAVLPGQATRALIPYRPVHGDLLRYEVALGRLRIATRAPSMAEFYRTTLGQILFSDDDFFTGNPICSLAVLQERGRLALEGHGIFGVIRVRLTECTWDCGDRSLIVFRDRDCFDLIERHGFSLAAGTLVQAKLMVDVVGKSTRPVIVTVRVPSRIEVSQRAHEPRMDQLLDAIGIRNASPAVTTLDLWSLYPWRHPLPNWRALFGASTDTLVRQGALHRVQLDAVPHPDHPSAGNVLRVHAIADGEFQGVSDVAEIPSRSLSATDVEALELIPERFRQYLRSSLGITSGGIAWNAADDVMDLGFLPVGDERLYVVYALRQPSSDTSDRIRTRAAGAHSVLLVPANRPDHHQSASVTLDGPLPSKLEVIRAATQACGFADRVPAIFRSDPDAELVVDTRLKKIWVRGREIEHLAPDSQAFLFIEMLARGNGAPVSSDEITKALSVGRLDTDGTTTARQAKMKAKKEVVAALQEDSAVDHGDPFPSASAGWYRCVLRCFVA